MSFRENGVVEHGKYQAYEFTELEFEGAGDRRTVFRIGTGPAVLVLHELPGMTDECLEVAGRIAGHEYTVYLPLLFGQPGVRATLRHYAHVCISREFRLLAARGTSPILGSIRSIGRQAHEDCGGPGLGVIGMCLTGNFAISMFADPNVLAPVTCQPSLPLPGSRRALHVCSDWLPMARAREAEGGRILGGRFSKDWICPRARLDRLEKELPDAFKRMMLAPDGQRANSKVEDIDSSKGNPHGFPRRSHSILCEGFIEDGTGSPSNPALEEVLEFLRTHLKPTERSIA